MYPLLRAAAVSSFLFAVTILSFRLTGVLNRTPPTSLSQLFSEPDGSACVEPCLFGIRPGVTTYDQVVAILKRHPLTRNYALSQVNPEDTIYRQIDLVGADVEFTLFARDKEPIEFFTLQYLPASAKWSDKQTALSPPAIKDVLRMFGLPK